MADAEQAHDEWYAKTKGYQRDDRTIMGAYGGFLAGHHSRDDEVKALEEEIDLRLEELDLAALHTKEGGG